MKPLFLLAALSSLAAAASFGQGTDNITVTGAASVNPASFSSVLTRSDASWNWQRQGLFVNAMELDPSNRLILTGTQTSAPGSIVIDPTSGAILINGQPVRTGSDAFTVTPSGYLGIGTKHPAARLDIEGTGNMIFNSGNVGIGADPRTQIVNSIPAAPLFIAEPGIASIRLMTTQANHSCTRSQEAIDFADGPGSELVGEIAAPNADYPDGEGLFQPRQMALWSAQSGGILLLARNWPGSAGPIVFADGDYKTGEVMRITPDHKVSIGSELDPASLLSIKGNASIGAAYSQTAAPANGLIIQGNLGIGTKDPAAKLDIEGAGNIIFNSGNVGIGADPRSQIVNSYPAASLFPAAPLVIAEPGIASIRLMTTQAHNSLTQSTEAIDFADGPGSELVGQIAALNADYPEGVGLYQPRQMTLWSGQSGGILFLARNWPGSAGPIVFADGDYTTGEVMRITPSHRVGIGTPNPQATLDVHGSALFSGPVQIQPQGDLSMGQFTKVSPEVSAQFKQSPQ